MNKKINKATNTLLLLVFSLVAIMSIVLTIKFIKPPPSEDESTSQEETTVEIKKDKDESQVGNTNGNLLQHYKNSSNFGLVESNNKYIFKYQIINKTECLTKTNIETKDTDIILTGYKVSNLNIVKNNLYMILEQKKDGETYEVIAYMDIESSSLTPINTTKSKDIISFIPDGKNIYYTTNDDFTIYKVDTDQAVSRLYNTNKKGTHPYLIGIREGKIYYVNGLEMGTIGINSKRNTIISTQYCSVDQYPIILKDSILCFEDLKHSKLDMLNLDGTYQKTIIEESQSKIPSRINALNYSCGYIFLLTDSKIYYLDKSSYEVNELKEATPKTSQIYFTDEYLILEEKENEKPITVPMSWLFAS